MVPELRDYLSVSAVASPTLFGYAVIEAMVKKPVLLTSCGWEWDLSAERLTVVRFVRDHGWTPAGLLPCEWPWLLGAIAFGGVLGPVALMFGLTRTSGATASLMFNLEAVLTAVLSVRSGDKYFA
jgi:drug/metabolite transporter (DMT)-like permease